MRRAAKVDSTQAEIVKGLRDAGYHVTIMKLPVDLAVRKSGWPPSIFAFLESKTPDAKGRVRERKDRETQNKFRAAHGVPAVCSSREALEWLREKMIT